MQVKYSPIRSDDLVNHRFNNEIVQITVDDISYMYDFSNLTDGQMIVPTKHIINAKRVDGELSIEIVNYIGADATEEERFPGWQAIEQADELDDNAQIVQIEWITKAELEDKENAAKPLTEIEIIQEKIAMQEQVIEELMFIILPELTGGGI